MRVPFYLHDLEPQVGDSVREVLASPFLTSGNIGRKVEQQLCDFFETDYALLTNSWTNGAIATGRRL